MVDDEAFLDDFDDSFEDDFDEAPPKRKRTRPKKKGTKSKSRNAGSGAKNSGGLKWLWIALGGCGLAIVLCCGGGYFFLSNKIGEITSGIEVPAGQTFSQWRDGFQTQLKTHAPAPQQYVHETPDSPLIEEVTYESDGLQLKAWVQRPESGEGPFPALVFFHGGFAFGAGDLEACEAFVKQGYVVMAPMVRGENGNPGDFELFLGEVDDARAATHWIAKQTYVDPNRVFAFGHSIGGGISAVLSLLDDVPIRHCGSSGGLYDHLTFFQWSDISPFPNIPEERSVRILVGNTAHMQRPHYGYIGDKDEAFHGVVDELKSAPNPEGRLHVEMVRGDHFSSFDSALRAYLRVCEQ